MYIKIAQVILVSYFFAAPAVAEPTRQNLPVVQVETTAGSLRIELYPQKAPITVRNFLRYVDQGFYLDTVFHRLLSGRLLQGGGFVLRADHLAAKTTGLNKAIRLESKNGLSNQRAFVAMARGSKPHSATSQFFINLTNNDQFDYPNPDGHGFAVFGKVVWGMKTVDRIADTSTRVLGAYRDVPLQPVVIKDMYRYPKNKAQKKQRRSQLSKSLKKKSRNKASESNKSS